MPQVTLGQDTFERLTELAADLKISVEQVIAPLLDEAAKHGVDGLNGHPPSRLTELPYPEWKREFDAWMKDVQTRADRYPSGFVLDDSRESIYKGCGE